MESGEMDVQALTKRFSLRELVLLNETKQNGVAVECGEEVELSEGVEEGRLGCRRSRDLVHVLACVGRKGC